MITIRVPHDISMSDEKWETAILTACEKGLSPRLYPAGLSTWQRKIHVELPQGFQPPAYMSFSEFAIRSAWDFLEERSDRVIIPPADSRAGKKNYHIYKSTMSRAHDLCKRGQCMRSRAIRDSLLLVEYGDALDRNVKSGPVESVLLPVELVPKNVNAQRYLSAATEAFLDRVEKQNG